MVALALPVPLVQEDNQLRAMKSILIPSLILIIWLKTLLILFQVRKPTINKLCVHQAQQQLRVPDNVSVVDGKLVTLILRLAQMA